MTGKTVHLPPPSVGEINFNGEMKRFNIVH